MATQEDEVVENAMTFIARIFNEIVSSPLNLALLGAIGYVAYRIITTQMEERKVKPEEPPLPKVKYILFKIALLNFSCHDCLCN